jgi:hypothetical protein
MFDGFPGATVPSREATASTLTIPRDTVSEVGAIDMLRRLMIKVLIMILTFGDS